MIRVAAAILGFGLLVGIATGNKDLTDAAMLIAAAAFILMFSSGRTALKCPYCRKRVKLGATVCHHCGRAVGRAA
jgi:hypothetical protein